MLSVAPNTISEICNNEQQPPLKTLRKKMALALDVDIRELLVPTKEYNIVLYLLRVDLPGCLA
jgi:hypothetical protein